MAVCIQQHSNFASSNDIVVNQPPAQLLDMRTLSLKFVLFHANQAQPSHLVADMATDVFDRMGPHRRTVVMLAIPGNI